MTEANPTLTAIKGIRVGHWTDEEAGTGCTVVVLPEPNVVAAEVRGAAPGTREVALLAPGMLVQQCQAIVLTGGSAFGLAAADGVVAELRQDERGHSTSHGVVPIVPAAVVYDRGVGDPDRFPSPASGADAYRAAATGPVEQGRVGAGTGCTVGKWRADVQPGGLGSATATVGDTTVGALVVLNAIGDIFSLDGRPLSGGPVHPEAAAEPPATGENTTLLVVATETPMTRSDLGRVIVRAHDAMGSCIRPAHTRFDGDICFAVSCAPTGVTAQPTDIDNAGEAAFVATGLAIAAALSQSR